MDNLLTPSEVSGSWEIPIATLAQWRYKGIGPRYVRVGRHVRYRSADLERWLESQANLKRGA